MRFLLYPNTTSDPALALAEALKAQLLAAGQEICVLDTPQQADMTAVLGGDGTVLRAVKALKGCSAPFWAVNCGHLGYLSDCPAAEASQALARILAGAYRLEYRTALHGTMTGDKSLHALNELLFHRGACGHALQLEVLVNGGLALKYRGDGLLVTTPTGSTAYNLSAGGPVLMPEMELLALTPICPQALSAVPMVVSARDSVRVLWRMEQYSGEADVPLLTADGEEKIPLPLQGEAGLGGAQRRIALVRTRDADFYGRLQHRMNWNA